VCRVGALEVIQPLFDDGKWTALPGSGMLASLMLATIAVGTDGSETASKAVAVAVEMARRFDAELVLLSAFKDSRNPSGPRGTAVELQWVSNVDARVREMLSRAEQELREQKIECRTMIDEGDPAEVLVRLAEECNADLLVIGNKGLQRRILGSVPNTVTHKAPCSVYVVKTT
jgi:nucleotide-binding universal stress UspA family protein